MLQQILRDMTIDPELLAELSDDQKQILFVKIREEQVRRWKVREEEQEKAEKQQNNKKQAKPGKKQVQFMKGRDGCDWVWVMGEHPSDKSIQLILEEEAQARALQLAEMEAEDFRKAQEKEIATLQKQLQEQKLKEKEREEELRRTREEAERSKSIKEARLAAQKLEAEQKRKEEEEKKKVEDIKKIQARTKKRSTEEADNIMHRRSTELYTKWKEMREQMLRKAEANSREVEEHWQEQEKKAKEAETRMRDMARTARLEYQESLRRTTNLIRAAQRFGPTIRQPDNRPPVPPNHGAWPASGENVLDRKHLMRGNAPLVRKPARPRPPKPPSREAVLEWFNSEEWQRGTGTDPNTGQVAEWFHGIISRDEAERLIRDKPVGSYLVRVSERVWGYTISFRDKERCKHFLIDTSDEGYQFLGANQILHAKLSDLVEFHKETPITISGQERLLYPVGQEAEPPDHAELFKNRRSESTAL